MLFDKMKVYLFIFPVHAINRIIPFSPQEKVKFIGEPIKEQLKRRFEVVHVTKMRSHYRV